MGDEVGEATRCAKFGGDRFMGYSAESISYLQNKNTIKTKLQYGGENKSKSENKT